MQKIQRFIGLVLGLVILSACEEPQAPEAIPLPKPEASRYVETGDLDALAKRGELRILSWMSDAAYLPREGSPLYLEQSLGAEFARAQGLKPRIVPIERFEDLIPALLAGRGDVIAANLTITEARKARIAFTVPVAHSQEMLLARMDDPIHKRAQLKGRRIAVQRGTTFEETLADLKKKYPGLGIDHLPGTLHPDLILDKLAAGEIDLTIGDSNVVEVVEDYRKDFKPVFSLGPERPLAWGVRPDNPQLLEALNQFITHAALTRRPASIHHDDLDGIKKRKTLRLLTRNNAATYFLWRGELMGFEYELAKRFAKRQGLRLEVIVAPDHESLLPMLREGRGDIAAAFLTPTPEREAMGVAFSRPYHYANEVIVGQADDKILDSVQDLAGRRVALRRSSSYWNTLQDIKNSGVNVKLIEVPESMETEEILARVARGKYDLSVADSHLLELEQTWRDDLKALLPLGEPQAHGWAMRAQDKKLHAAVDAFLKKEYRSTDYNLLYSKYFRNKHSVLSHKEERVNSAQGGALSPYDDLAKKYADRYNFDWRLIVSQMYQESRFDPDAKSWAGARGLMQVLPRTGRQMGITDLKDPEQSIHAGVKYLNWLRERFDAELPVRDRMWFALASYNAGAGHVHDARRLARKKGWNANRWFDNVERAMLLLAKPQHAKHARHGYVRGRETVNYVRKINARYQAYVGLTGPES